MSQFSSGGLPLQGDSEAPFIRGGVCFPTLWIQGGFVTHAAQENLAERILCCSESRLLRPCTFLLAPLELCHNWQQGLGCCREKDTEKEEPSCSQQGHLRPASSQLVPNMWKSTAEITSSYLRQVSKDTCLIPGKTGNAQLTWGHMGNEQLLIVSHWVLQ